MAEARLLYGQVIMDAMGSGDGELLKAMSTVSTFMLSKASGDDEALQAWKEADAKLKDALG